MCNYLKIIFILALCNNTFANQQILYDFESDYRIHTPSVHGGIGLIQTPTARFAPDGELGFGVSSEGPYRRVYGTMQFFPWMEAALKYTETTYKFYARGSSQTWKDKGLDIKFRLHEETDQLPEIALGLIDFAGTGAYSSEYLVGTKRLNNFDLSLGLGWGRLGGIHHFDNLIGYIDEERNKRGGYKSTGGTVNLKRFFSGENTSIFGGIEYFSPNNNLSFKAEYDTSDYSRAIGKPMVFNKPGNDFKVDSRFNYSVNYRFDMTRNDKVDLSLGYVRGNTIYANFLVHSNLNYKMPPKVVIGAEKIRNSNLPGKSFSELDEKWQTFLTNRIIKEMANNGFVTHKIIYKEDELIAEVSQGRFFETTKFFDLASRVLANNALQNIETITIINIDQGIETIRSSIDIDDLKRVALLGPTPENLLDFDNPSDAHYSDIEKENQFLYPNFYWEVRPHLNNTLQHQIKFFFWQLEALIHTEYSFAKGLYLTTDFGVDIASNFDEYTWHVPDGELHHVRQDRRLYLTEGKSGLRRMQLDYLLDFHPNIKAKLTAGYLEWMYGGIGGEILYMPESRRWGIGVDAYWVKQRDFDQKLSFRDYQTITGFLSYYQDLPFYDMRLKLSVGKFLGKDTGAMIDISRRFENGGRVGGFAALTDCDSACVGEGSFHKGVYFELPMNIFYIQSTTRRKTGYAWSPLTKDAGAKVDAGGLYFLMTNAADEVTSLRQKQWSFKKIFSGFSTKKISKQP
tara:strand:- start:538 stop:2757 length:2220 start_codon:yes stop_codon:yes gene_type:complete